MTKYIGEAQWQDDCQGKKDYDFAIAGISCRYYPASYNRDGQVSCYVQFLVAGVVMAQDELKDQTESELKAKVEAWAKHHNDLVVTALNSTS